jgi:hypothetical protein
MLSSRVDFFVWSAALGKILMLDNLRMMNVVVVEWCCMYKKNVEWSGTLQKCQKMLLYQRLPMDGKVVRYLACDHFDQNLPNIPLLLTEHI